MPSNDKRMTEELRSKALFRNLYWEIGGLIRLENLPPFNSARKILFLGVGELIEYGDYCDSCLREKIRLAGEMLYNAGGMAYMHDPLVWLFIPQSLQRTIDIIWDGIGDWKA